MDSPGIVYSYITTLVHALALHYDTRFSIYSTTRSRIMYVCVCCVCVPEAQGTCDVLPIAQLRTTLADALIAGRRFLPRHINHIPTHPHYTLTRAKPQIQLHNGKIKKIYIMEIPQISQTEMQFILVTRSVVLLTQCAPYCCLITRVTVLGENFTSYRKF